ncbi:hypothetical protein GUY44_17320 [Pimelobacter simplex]|uniref:Uncharacterized protein n=1 Tax=Nocardioides simplex TaxID=2045 RepID=A0A0A1DQ06_NOCSI|nr:hypothetical protein [Pimelobacter simplex]AIY18702.1 hypothetical protein KR76_21470 [Pimelobacter simplex]MCG8152252.1 hypothetical protein [Pimelobacter simplex]GEB14369.1 hypothetical protein NSI01_26840 [Pimelobacter simplex]SFM30541.1 hypothetical protein SAMN05421671_1050 [Pimelobacter simplex]
MRRLLILLGTAALGLSVLGVLPAPALAATTWLSVSTDDPLLNENGDGLWESATVDVRTDAGTAHWALTKDGQGAVVAEAELTTAQRSGEPLSVSSATAGGPLAAGTYTLTVTATAVGKAPATKDAKIYVSTGPALTALAPSAAMIYPQDYYPGVAHDVSFRHGLDATIVQQAAPMFEVVGAGRTIGPWNLDPGVPLLRWDGRGNPLNDVVPGTYRVRLLVRDDGRQTYGPLSQPFRVSRGHRELVSAGTFQKANATRTATLTKRLARLRIVNGSLRYRAFHRYALRDPLIRTAHRVRIPVDRAAGAPVHLVVNGRQEDEINLDLEVVLPDGRVRNIDNYSGASEHSLAYTIPRRLIRPDGTVRFRLLWTPHPGEGDGPGAGRVDTVSVRVNKYVWRDLD